MTLCNNTMQRTLNGGRLSSEMGDMIKLLPSSVEVEWGYSVGRSHCGYATTQVRRSPGEEIESAAGCRHHDEWKFHCGWRNSNGEMDATCFAFSLGNGLWDWCLPSIMGGHSRS